jgi:hypothetical protein
LFRIRPVWLRRFANVKPSGELLLDRVILGDLERMLAFA